MPLLPQILLVEVLLGGGALHPLDEDIELSATDARFVEATWVETVVRGRPWVPNTRIATVNRGTRFTVRGIVESRDDQGCDGKPWYAVHPFGFVCSRHVRVTDDPPSARLALPVPEGNRLPFAYAFVREDGVSMYDSLEAIESATPSRQLVKGMSLVIERTVDAQGKRFVLTSDGHYVDKDDVRWGGQGSAWAGVPIDVPPGRTVEGPSFAWATKDATPVYAQPSLLSEKVGTLALRERVPLLEQGGAEGKPRWWRIGDGRWVEGSRLNEVHFQRAPSGVLDPDHVGETGNDQWIDVDVGEQVLVAYRGDTPVYATLVSSGRSHGTPLGNYPIWAKVASMTMANQEYEDEPYMVQGVPWVLLFQGDNAIHGAYWHDRFGVRKSHGCVNLSPIDARWVFEWVAPTLPEGWTGYLPDLGRSVVVHVRDSSKPPGEQFTQERRIGPPDPEEEKKKLEAATARREAAGLAADTNPGPNPLHEQTLQSRRIEPPPLPDLLGDGT